MHSLLILFRYRFRSFLNLFAQQIRENKLKFVIITASVLVLWFLIFMFFHRSFIFLRSFQEIGDIVTVYFLALFFFALGIMLVISNAIINYSSLFRSLETDYLMSLPIPFNWIFIFKITESVAFSSWAFLFLGSPMLIAYGIDRSAGWSYYVWMFLYSLIYVIFPALIGSIISIIAARFFPRHRKYVLLAFIVIIVLLAIVVLSQMLPLGTSKFPFTAVWMQTFLDKLSFAQNPFLPSLWVMRGLVGAATGDASEAIFFFLLLVSQALFLGMLTVMLTNAVYFNGYSLVRSYQREKKYKAASTLDYVFLRLFGFLRLPLRLIMIKDMKTLIRDPVQWSQLMIFFGLLGVYFVNIKNIPYINLEEMLWQYLVLSLNLIATTLTLATFTTRFVYPQISLEGKRFWIIGMMPISRKDIFFSKFIFAFMGAVLLTEPLIFISSYQIGIPLPLLLHQLYLAFLICLGLSSLSVSLGVFYPNLREDNPSKIVSGFGGTLTLVLSLLYVLTIVVIGSAPGHLYYVLGRISQSTFQQFQLISIGITLIIAALTTFIAISLGLKSIQKLEV